MKGQEEKTKFTLEHAQMFFQTYADILAEKYAPNIEVVVKVERQEETTK